MTPPARIPHRVEQGSERPGSSAHLCLTAVPSGRRVEVRSIAPVSFKLTLNRPRKSVRLMMLVPTKRLPHPGHLAALQQRNHPVSRNAENSPCWRWKPILAARKIHVAESCSNLCVYRTIAPETDRHCGYQRFHNRILKVPHQPPGHLNVLSGGSQARPAGWISARSVPAFRFGQELAIRRTDYSVGAGTLPSGAHAVL